MADATVSRLGQSNQTGSPTQLFLEVFAGMVLEAFDKKQLTLDKHIVRTIKSGNSAQFPLTWKATASAHTPGTEITGTKISHAERNIPIEFLLIADAFIANIDEAMNHYEVRSIYSHQIGEALANAFDQNVFRSIYLGSEVAVDTPITGMLGGWQKVSGTIDTDIAVLRPAVYDAAEMLDTKDVPEDGRYMAFAPAQYYLLLEDGEFLHRDYAGEGNKTRVSMPWAAGFQILKSNNIPLTNDTANTDVPTALRADYTQNVAAAWQTFGAGTVKLLDLKVESEYDIRRQGTLLVGKYAMGHDYLRPECCVSFAQA